MNLCSAPFQFRIGFVQRRDALSIARYTTLNAASSCGNTLFFWRKRPVKQIQHIIELSASCRFCSTGGIMQKLSPFVAQFLGGKSLLAKNRFDLNELGKPDRPKEAMEFVLRPKSISRSSAIFEEMAKKVSLRKCKDRAFLKLREFLHRKFPETE